MSNDHTLRTPFARKAVLVDVDGTLCDVSGVRHYVQSDPKHRNFDKFHRASALCPAIPSTVAWVREHHTAGATVIVVTSRKQHYEHLTRVWLRKWDVPYDRLLLRNNHDERRDDLVKADLLAKIRAEGYEVIAAIDDNPSIIALWESEGIPVTIVPGWTDPVPDIRDT